MTAAIPAREATELHAALVVADDNSDAVHIEWSAQADGINVALPALDVQAAPLGVAIPFTSSLVALFGNSTFHPAVTLTGTATDATGIESTFRIGPFAVGNDAPQITTLALSTTQVNGLAVITFTVADSAGDSARLSLTGNEADAFALDLDDATFPAGNRAGLLTSPEGLLHTIAWDSTHTTTRASETAALFLRAADAATSETRRVDFALFNNAPPVLANLQHRKQRHRVRGGVADHR